MVLFTLETRTGGVNMGLFGCPKTSPCSTFIYLPWRFTTTEARQGRNGALSHTKSDPPHLTVHRFMDLISV